MEKRGQVQHGQGQRQGQVIWFNRWFSSIYHNINELKSNLKDGDKILTSSTNPTQLYLSLGDIHIEEPHNYGDDEYVQWALEVCKKYGVTTFFPKAYMRAISKNKGLFEDIGVRVVVEDYELFSLIHNKSEVYEYIRTNQAKAIEKLQQKGISAREVVIPPYSVHYSVSPFGLKISKYLENYGKACIKLNHDEGAGSFRVIYKEPDYDTFEHSPRSSAITLDEAMSSYYKLLSKSSQNTGILAMPYLDTPEISVDCYNDPEYGFMGVAREKSGRNQILNKNHVLMEQCKTIQEIYGFRCPYNVQFMTFKGEAVLLEINPRLSGGSCYDLAAGVDFVSTIVTGDDHLHKKPDIQTMIVGKIEGYIPVEQGGLYGC